MTKVVINNAYGGFSISRECQQRMIELGADIEDTYYEMPDGEQYVTLDYEYPRHCKFLVQAVEELGPNAAGIGSTLVICEIKGDRYIIKEYDGAESVVEPDGIDWIYV